MVNRRVESEREVLDAYIERGMVFTQTRRFDDAIGTALFLGALVLVLTTLAEGVSLGTLEYAPHTATTGYLAFLALVLYMGTLVLLAILRLGKDAYGIPILDEVSARSGREVSRATVYVALKRLEAKDLIHSTMGDPTPERGGRAKRYFQISPLAERRLIEAREALMKMWANLPIVERPS